MCWNEETTVCRIFSCNYQLFDIVWDDSRDRRQHWAALKRETPGTAFSLCARPQPQALFPVVIGEGSHPFPFRTRKLSLIPPMVLCGKLHGRVGRCRHYSTKARCSRHRAFSIWGGPPAYATDGVATAGTDGALGMMNQATI